MTQEPLGFGIGRHLMRVYEDHEIPEQIAIAIAKARSEALEEAARMAEEMWGHGEGVAKIAAAIRALASSSTKAQR